MNAEFQRIARRDKKDFLSNQCKEIEENNRMGKSRYLFKKMRDTKRTFHAKMGTIENGNGMDLTEPKKKHYPVMDVTGDRRKVQCCKEQYCIRSWNVRSMNQGKFEVVKWEMARVNINILGISELTWTGMGEFNSDDHYIYYCGQESLRRNGVAIMVNKRVQDAVLGCNLKNDRMISVRF